jgi:hypothetical protein
MNAAWVRMSAAVLQHELEIAVTEGEHQIPSDRPQDHLSGELPTLESLIPPYLCCLAPSRHATASTRLDRQHKDATEPGNPHATKANSSGADSEPPAPSGGTGGTVLLDR